MDSQDDPDPWAVTGEALGNLEAVIQLGAKRLELRVGDSGRDSRLFIGAYVDDDLESYIFFSSVGGMTIGGDYWVLAGPLVQPLQSTGIPVEVTIDGKPVPAVMGERAWMCVVRPPTDTQAVAAVNTGGEGAPRLIRLS